MYLSLAAAYKERSHLNDQEKAHVPTVPLLSLGFGNFSENQTGFSSSYVISSFQLIKLTINPPVPHCHITREPM